LGGCLGIAAYELIDERCDGVAIRRTEMPQIPVHLLVQIGRQQEVLVLGEAVAERQNRMAEGVSAGDDAHDARILEAGKIMPTPQRFQHVPHALCLPARVVEIEVNTKAIARRARQLGSPANVVSKRLTPAVCSTSDAAKLKQVPPRCRKSVVENSTPFNKHLGKL